MKTKHTCEGHVFSDHWSRPCGKSAAHEYEGHWYCKTHHPPTVAAKSAARSEWRQAKWDAEREAARAKKLTADEQKRRADCYDDLLGALDGLAAQVRPLWAELDIDGFRHSALKEAYDFACKVAGKAQGEPQ